MHLVQLLRARLLFARPANLRMQFDPSDGEPAFRVLLHVTDCFVSVIIQDKLLFTRDREKGEHVTTGERSDESLLGIDVGRIAQIGRRGGRGYLAATIEAPGVIARLLLINKFSSAVVATQSNLVVVHTVRIRPALWYRRYTTVWRGA